MLVSRLVLGPIRFMTFSPADRIWHNCAPHHCAAVHLSMHYTFEAATCLGGLRARLVVCPALLAALRSAASISFSLVSLAAVISRTFTINHCAHFGRLVSPRWLRHRTLVWKSFPQAGQIELPTRAAHGARYLCTIRLWKLSAFCEVNDVSQAWQRYFVATGAALSSTVLSTTDSANLILPTVCSASVLTSQSFHPCGLFTGCVLGAFSEWLATYTISFTACVVQGSCCWSRWKWSTAHKVAGASLTTRVMYLKRLIRSMQSMEGAPACCRTCRSDLPFSLLSNLISPVIRRRPRIYVELSFLMSFAFGTKSCTLKCCLLNTNRKHILNGVAISEDPNTFIAMGA